MILVPEIQTVVVLVPRTGSGALRREIAARYPKSMQIYRHMEADGVPHGYDRWPKVGVVRHPIVRLWSLFKFLQNFGGDYEPVYVENMRRSVRMDFSDWIVNNDVVFTHPFDSSGQGRFFPGYTVRHAMPENKKSQFVYLRPDLGTEVYRYTQIKALESRLGLKLDRQDNVTDRSEPPHLSLAASEHVRRWFAWDLEQF